MKIEIGTYEAKTRLPELLREVRAGKRFTITHRGVPVADLVPSRTGRHPDKAAAVERFRAFLRDHPVRRTVRVRDLIESGRE